MEEFIVLQECLHITYILSTKKPQKTYMKEKAPQYIFTEESFDNNLFAMIKYIVTVWINLSNMEKDIIIELIDQPLQRKDLANKLNVESGTLSKYLTNLIQLDLISNNKGTYTIHEDMLKRWLKTEYENKGVYPYRF